MSISTRAAGLPVSGVSNRLRNSVILIPSPHRTPATEIWQLLTISEIS